MVKDQLFCPASVPRGWTTKPVRTTNTFPIPRTSNAYSMVGTGFLARQQDSCGKGCGQDN